MSLKVTEILKLNQILLFQVRICNEKFASRVVAWQSITLPLRHASFTIWEMNVLITLSFYQELFWLYIKVRGPFVQILCIEKDSYMDAI